MSEDLAYFMADGLLHNFGTPPAKPGAPARREGTTSQPHAKAGQGHSAPKESQMNSEFEHDCTTPTTFALWRRVDPTGVSGTGIVADVVRFGDGVCVVRWRGKTPTTTVHEDTASVLAVHGHGGQTRLVLLESHHSSSFEEGWRIAQKAEMENWPAFSYADVARQYPHRFDAENAEAAAGWDAYQTNRPAS